MIQDPDGRFYSKTQVSFETDKISEDTDAVFFDADGDGDQDLYVTSGGNEFSSSSMALADRLYLNDGTGNFEKSDQALPEYRFISTSCVKVADYDNDGDPDLFVGARLRPFLYGVPVNGYILNNNGQGYFKNVTDQIAPDLKETGMITDMAWVDYDGDGDQDIIIAGDWMPVKVFENQEGKFIDVSAATGLMHTNGLWNTLEAGDFDNDGDIDFVAGNMGLNSRIKASRDKPATMYINDFDGNGVAEQIICTYNGDKQYPLVNRQDLLIQIPGLKKKYPAFDDYKEQQIENIFGPEIVARSVKLDVFTTATSLFINNGNGVFETHVLPVEVQFAPVYAIKMIDFDGDGDMDMLLGGNKYRAKPETGIYDASYGLALKADNDLTYKVMKSSESGIFLKGQIRDIVTMVEAKRRLILFAKNNAALKVYEY